jgi:hypothetical protein
MISEIKVVENLPGKMLQIPDVPEKEHRKRCLVVHTHRSFSSKDMPTGCATRCMIKRSGSRPASVLLCFL